MLAAIAVPLMLVVGVVAVVIIYEVRRMKRIRRNLPREGMDPPGFEVELKKTDEGARGGGGGGGSSG